MRTSHSRIFHFIFRPMVGVSLALSVQASSPKSLPAKKIVQSRSPAQVQPPSQSVTDKAPSAFYSIEDFLENQRQAFERSSSRVVLTRAEKEADLQRLIAKTQDPWAIKNASTISRVQVAGSPQEYDNKTTLSYARKEGFSFSTYFDQADSSDRTISPTKSWQTYGFSLEYEFLKTSQNFQETLAIADLSEKISKLSVESSYLSQISSLNDAGLSLFVQHCKLRDNQKLESLMLQTLKIAEVQYASKSIDIQDYLRMNDLYLSFQRSIQSALSGIISTEQSFANIGDENLVLAKALASKNLDCDKINRESQALTQPKKDDVEDLIRQHPSMISLQLQKDEAKRNQNQFNLSHLPSLSAGTGVDRYNPGFGQNFYYNTSASLTVSYSFREDNYKYTKFDYAKKIGDLDYSEKVMNLQLMGQFHQLYESMSNQANFAQIARKSLENSDRNLKVTQTRQAVGMINSDAIYSAYSNYSSSIQAMRDLWQSYKTSEYRLAEIKKSIERSKRYR